MILGILMICNTAMECMPVPNIHELYHTREECEVAANAVAQEVPEQFSVAIYCYEVNYDVGT